MCGVNCDRKGVQNVKKNMGTCGGRHLGNKKAKGTARTPSPYSRKGTKAKGGGKHKRPGKAYE